MLFAFAFACTVVGLFDIYACTTCAICVQKKVDPIEIAWDSPEHTRIENMILWIKMSTKFVQNSENMLRAVFLYETQTNFEWLAICVAHNVNSQFFSSFVVSVPFPSNPRSIWIHTWKRENTGRKLIRRRMPSNWLCLGKCVDYAVRRLLLGRKTIDFESIEQIRKWVSKRMNSKFSTYVLLKKNTTKSRNFYSISFPKRATLQLPCLLATKQINRNLWWYLYFLSIFSFPPRFEH